MSLTSVTVLVPSEEVTLTAPIPVIPVEDKAVSTAQLFVKTPVRVVPEAKVIVPVVLASSVFKATGSIAVSDNDIPRSAVVF